MYHPFKNITAGTNYLVELHEPDELDEILIQHLGYPAGIVHHNFLWGKKGKWLSETGRKLGWIPNQLPVSFFSETVIDEISHAFIGNQNILLSGEIEQKKAKFLLERLQITYLAEQNPFLLSAGENHQLLFLTQWAKQPQILVSSYLPTNLSPARLNQLLNFIFHSEELASGLEIHPPNFILGFLPDQTDWYHCLISAQPNWKKNKVSEIINLT